MNNLLQNLLNNYSFVQSDFVKVNFDIEGIFHYILSLLIASLMIVSFYFIGKKIDGLLFRYQGEYSLFASVALGYVLFGMGIGLLGILSLLRFEVLIAYLLLMLVIAFFPFSFKPEEMLSSLYRETAKFQSADKLIFLAVALFIAISFTRLATPEITEDAYHTDLPRFYLKTESSIHPSRDPLHVIPYPQLPEMTYIIPIFMGEREAVRFVHFAFYVFIVALLYKFSQDKIHSFAKYAPLLFVSAPVVVRYAPSQYTDFFMLFTFLLSIFLINKNGSYKILLLSGLMYGAALSAKIWILIYLPAVILYIILLSRRLKISAIGKRILAFMFSAVAVASLWYIRAFLITGNPLFPLFASNPTLEASVSETSSFSYFGFNTNMFDVPNLIVLSPFFFVAILLLILNLRKVITTLGKAPISTFVLMISLEQLIVKVDFGRYLVSWYTFFSIAASSSLAQVLKLNFLKTMVFLIVFLEIGYYFVNTLLILPYGLGFSDKNKYLTRVLSRDNASYYDFDRLFDRHIMPKDVVATYGIYGFYYANFDYVDINFVFSREARQFERLKVVGATKLLIKGGDINWFCNILSLKNCDAASAKLLASYPPNVNKYNLYELKW